MCPAGIDARNVSSAADALDLRDALLCSGPGVFEVSWSGRVALTRTIVVSNGTSVRFSGYGTGEADGAGIVRLFEVHDGSTLELDRFSLVRGAESGEVIEGTFIGYGGGLLVSGSSRLAVSSCSFVSNFATFSGGKIDDDVHTYMKHYAHRTIQLKH